MSGSAAPKEPQKAQKWKLERRLEVLKEASSDARMGCLRDSVWVGMKAAASEAERVAVSETETVAKLVRRWELAKVVALEVAMVIKLVGWKGVASGMRTEKW